MRPWWMAAVVLVPALLWGGRIRPGVVITKQNLPQYEEELKRLLPMPYQEQMFTALRNGWITIPVVETRWRPPKLYPKVSERNRGKFKVGPRNKVIPATPGGERWIVGLPFPDPKTGAEIAWNIYRRREWGDECTFYADFILLARGPKGPGTVRERTFSWWLRKKNWTGRYILEPIPEMPGNNGVIESKESIVIVKPFDVRGFSQLRVRYEDIERDDDSYCYLPALRRVRRMTGADLTDPILGSDCVPDDFEFWRERIKPNLTFRILERNRVFLVPRYYAKRPPEPFIRVNAFQCEWELRPLTVLEVLENDPNYAYSKRIVWTDERRSYVLRAAANYDQRGRYWRGSGGDVPVIDAKTWENNLHHLYTYFDHLKGHYSIMDFRPKPLGTRVPAEAFSFRWLLKHAK